MKKLLLLCFVIIPMYAFTPINISYGEKEYYDRIDAQKAEEKRMQNIEMLMQTFSYLETRGNYSLNGLSGEKGSYQILPTTWDFWNEKYFDKHLPITPENEKLMIHTVITDWLNHGLTIEQIAAKWNSGSHKGWKNKVGVNRFGVPYNVPQYVAKFVDKYNQIKANS